MKIIISSIIIFIIGWDMASYKIMKKFDSFYPKRNKYLFGYNSFKLFEYYKRSIKKKIFYRNYKNE